MVKRHRELQLLMRGKRVWFVLASILAMLVLAMALSVVLTRGQGVVQGTVVVPHSVYIWQREWTAGVREAIQRSQGAFAEWVVLVAEVEFRAGLAPRVVRVSPDYECLRRSGRPVGLALRVAPYAGSFAAHRPESVFLVHLVRELVDDARHHGIEPASLHLDFDAATRQLGDYCLWLAALRGAADPTPLVVTALPTWLDSPDFARLVQAADGYVLQVHSWEPPHASMEGLQLCDTKRARAAIKRAASLGRPFWVALPTYGYQAYFDDQGRLVRLAAEGPELGAPAGLKMREVRADPASIAELVNWLQHHLPAKLRGFIWYRLPQSEDRLNWHWRTLEAVIQGRSPEAKTELQLRHSTEGLVDLTAYAAGEADSLLDRPILLSWESARLLAADGLAGFAAIRAAPHSLSFSPADHQPIRLSPGQSLTVGWLRFEHPTEIRIHEDNPAFR
ncbi:MAG TPA: hypothetical protein DEO88_00030 [Syntrophobacteraceae bacterium]|nr:hypothetical protein [Syntrophobacteraceae bacterium]